MARIHFIQQLTELGFSVHQQTVQAQVFAVFDYEIPVGRFRGQNIQMALEAKDSFPMDAPPGPHFKPHLFPINPPGAHPTGGIHGSPLGADWQYWSRPFHQWATTNRTVRAYLAHIKNLLITT